MPYLRVKGDIECLLKRHMVGGIKQFGDHLAPLVAHQGASRVVEIRVLGILLRRKRAIFHHGKRRHVAVMHIAARRIGDLNEIRERMNPLAFVL